MVEPADEDLIEILKTRDGVCSVVWLRNNSRLRCLNIAWGYDGGDRYAHISTNVSPSIGGEAFDFFHSYEVAAVVDPVSDAVLFTCDGDDGPAEEWLLSLGYELVASQADGVHWVGLRSVHNPSFVQPEYGSGSSHIEAVVSAAERWRVEQIGSRPTGRKLP